MTELLLADYTRRGFMDGVALRLPTIVIRPGKPNRAASSFLSGILREPLSGQTADLPVSEDLVAWVASPRIAVESLLHAAALPRGAVKEPGITGRGISVSVGQMLEALEKIAGPKARALVKPAPDPEVARIVGSWPKSFEVARASELGFPVDAGIEEIIRSYIRDYGADRPEKQAAKGDAAAPR